MLLLTYCAGARTTMRRWTAGRRMERWARRSRATTTCWRPLDDDQATCSVFSPRCWRESPSTERTRSRDTVTSSRDVIVDDIVGVTTWYIGLSVYRSQSAFKAQKITGILKRDESIAVLSKELQYSGWFKTIIKLL